MKIRELYESDWFSFKGEKDFDSRNEFEETWVEEFNDCDYLFLDGDKNMHYAVWIMECDGEVIYYIPSEEDYDYNYNYIEEILEVFYLNDRPQNYGFEELDLGFRSLLDKVDVSKVEGFVDNRPHLFYRGGKGYSYSAWQYNK